MIIVDDHLALRALAGEGGTYWPGETPFVPWTFHLRILRALHDDTSTGTLSRGNTQQMIDRAKRPPREILRVIDPRLHSVAAAVLMAHHRLNFLAADFLGAAKQYGAPIYAAEGNVGEHWNKVCRDEEIELHIIAAPDQP